MQPQFPDLSKFDRISFDTETTGLQYPVDRAFGFSIGLPTGEGFYYDLRETPQARCWFNDSMKHYTGLIIAHNASFDYRMAGVSGLYMPIDQLDDTVIRACLIDEHLHQYSLDELAMLYLDDRKVNDIYKDLAELFGGLATRNVQMKNLLRAPSSIVAPYAIKDALLTLRLWEWQEKEIERQNNMGGTVSLRTVVDFERCLMEPLIMMEMAGIRVDLDKAERASNDITPLIADAQNQLNNVAGYKVNVNSSPQIRKLFNPDRINGSWYVNGTRIEQTDSGAPSFGSSVLRELENDERAQLILKIRTLTKTRDTFIKGHVLSYAVDSRVYPTINQSKGEQGGTSTGRLSIQNPAMQQIPSRDKTTAAIVKPIFLPNEGQVWVDMDESSFEVRVFAHLLGMIGERSVIKAYRDNPRTDFHQWVADLTGLPRNASYPGQPYAKQLNLSAIFNSGNGAIANKMGMPWEWAEFIDKQGTLVKYMKAGPEAMRVIDTYHSHLPGVKRLADTCKKVAEDRGFIHTGKGRRMRFPNKWKTYKASGLLIQSTAADYNKENILMLSQILNQHQGSLLLNTHDSYSMSLPEENINAAWRDIRATLEAPDRANVPLLLDLSGWGTDWWNALTSKKTIG